VFGCRFTCFPIRLSLLLASLLGLLELPLLFLFPFLLAYALNQLPGEEHDKPDDKDARPDEDPVAELVLDMAVLAATG